MFETRHHRGMAEILLIATLNLPSGESQHPMFCLIKHEQRSSPASANMFWSKCIAFSKGKERYFNTFATCKKYALSYHIFAFIQYSVIISFQYFEIVYV